MSGRDVAQASRLPSAPEEAGSLRYLEPRQRRQVFWITIAAAAIFVGFRLLPTGTNLSHMDFRVDPRAGNAIEFCDPLNPQFIPVVTARSPVEMSLTTAEPAARGRELHAVVTLRTASGKPIAPEDLLVTHTQRLHLLIIDPTLTDYQHVHPTPAKRAGQWAFAFTPVAKGTYRIFADFTPTATGRGLYASVDLNVSGTAGGPPATGSRPAAGGPSQTVDRDGYRFTLTTAQSPLRVRQPIDLRFAIERASGGGVALEPVMGAFAHLVAFDAARSGFAHLHPVETDRLKVPGADHPALNFKLTIPRAGSYVIWAQVKIEGRETFVPFGIEVVE